MLGSLAVAALLSLIDPSGDTNGNGTLTAPSATLMREREAFDIVSVSVPEADTFGLRVGMERVSGTFPQAILEFYLTDTDTSGRQTETQTEDGQTARPAALLPGSGMRLPTEQAWIYAVRMIGDRAQLFDRRSGEIRNLTDAAGVRLERSGNTLTLTTPLPLPRHFSLYGMSGSFDPLSATGWRELRETTSPWGFAGTQNHPVLDVVAERPALQQEALRLGVLPEIRASFRESGWLFVAGAGVALALGGFAARVTLGRRERPVTEPTRDAVTERNASARQIEETFSPTPLSPFDASAAFAAINSWQQGQAQLVMPGTDPKLTLEPVAG